MLGMEALLSSLRISTICKVAGIDAVRCDYDPQAAKLYLSYRRKGKVEFLEVPCGVTYTPDRLDQLLSPCPADAPSAIAQNPPAEIPPDPLDTSP